MIHRYAAPIDDLCQTDALTVVGSAEDAAYPAENLTDENPAKPAKLTTTSGNFVIDFAGTVTAKGAALLYHNIDAGVTVTLQANSSDSWGSPPFSETFTIPALLEDGWTVSPWIEFDAVTYRFWRLLFSGTNTYPISVGRLCIVTEFREAWAAAANDVRWGVQEDEDHGLIELPTELGVETIYPLGGKRRRFSGELALQDATTAEFIGLVRRAGGRELSWLLIPDAAVNDTWVVRFDESRWSRTRETINHNIFPFHVRELSRGLPWP